MTRSKKAGLNMASAIIEMVHLMYQDRTAYHFLKGLIDKLTEELQIRGK